MDSYGLAATCLWLVLATARCEVLTPPYFNIAENRYVEASSTCGADVEEAELYCKLTGTNQDSIHPENLVIQGQVCDWCNMSNPSQMHPARYAVDGSENFWMSPPLSRGQDYNQVNFSINLGQEFHVSYVLIKMGNSPRPGVWVLERSADNGQTYKPWQYFADNDIECELFFGRESLQPITADDSVTCETSYSKIVPLQGGEIVISLINQRPSANDFFNSPVLQEFTRATNVRLRFLRAKTLLGHLMSIAREDPSVTRRYFYSIKDISIGGRCRCNGHADLCDETHPTDLYKLLCRCKHNTTGENCERCQDNMVQKAWQQSKPNKLFVCEACNCHGHTDRCIYNETVDQLKLSMDIYGNYDGGGVCQDCQDNTEGINCEKCTDGYFRPYHKSQNETDACQRCPCDDIFYDGTCAMGSGKCFCDEKFAGLECDKCAHGYFGYPDCKPCICFLNGTSGEYCEPLGGTCPCLDNFAGFDCRECSLGFYDFPNCSPCECNTIGSLDNECDSLSGKCECNSNFGGDKCTECADGYYDFPSCGYCSCDTRGSTEDICSKETGECFCKEGYGGARCDQCLPGYYGFPDCHPCNCSDVGSSSKACDVSGKCPCLSSYGGQRCDRCVPGYYNYPQCLSCHCDTYGSQGISCDDSGKCTCSHLYTGHKCEKCEEGRFNFPMCEECSCHPAGIVENFPGCGNLSTIGQLCQCKPRVEGRTCDQCRPLFWNLAMSNPHGCQECDCYEAGILGGINECNTVSGQCMCKPFTKSRRCDSCIDGMFDQQENNLFGCTDCGCDVGGSENEACDKVTGQCRCRPRVAGRTCSEPRKAHYYPTLYQFKYEAENGTTPDKKSVRFGSSEDIFPGYSWKGFVVFSKIQSDLIHEVEVLTQTIYHMILRFINPNDDNVKLDISVSQPDGDQIPQVFEVIVKPTPRNQPQFVILPAKGSSIPAPLVLDPGQWNVHIHNDRPLFLDYFVLLPAAYYEGNILVDRVVTPCNVSHTSLCKHFKYPTVSHLPQAHTKLGFVFERGSRQPLLEFIPEEHLNKLGRDRGIKTPMSDKIAVLSDIQPEMTVELPVKQEGSHVLLISYITTETNPQPLDIKLQARVSIDTTQNGRAKLPSCPYTWLCRQVVLDSDGRVAHFDLDPTFVSSVTIQSNNNAPTGIESVIAVPSQDWSVDYITPKPVCVSQEGHCMETKFFTPLDFKKVEFESGSDAKLSATTPPEAMDKTAGFVYLDKEQPQVTIKGKVPQPGEYVFIVHYYQPDYSEYTMDAVLEDNDVSRKASLVVGHCPSNSGCRTTLNNIDTTQFFEINSNFSLNFKQPNHSSVWFDYLLIVPAAKYNERLVEEEPIVKSSLFVNECGKNFFYLDNNASEFCKSSVFSVTTAYNEGALPCKCRPEGSQSLQCDQFGGQCDCKPHIIGRRCEECKPGYFGYPDCRRCDCPALCDEVTGECMCPPRVTGPNCDRCDNLTFGYHAIVGCEPCDCNPWGVSDNLQCDLFEGICSCKRNVEGRKCDHCSAGYFGFPDCEECECDFRGTTDEKCDQETANCICKKNVDGQACDVCKEGTFNIQAKNPQGCTKCFCFGKTTQCSSSRLYRTLITGMNDWGISLINMSLSIIHVDEVDGWAEPVEGTAEAVGVDLTNEAYDDKIVYLVAPPQYLGNRLTAYGGYLRYSLFCTTGPMGSPIDDAPGVILFGASTYLLHFSHEVPSIAEYFNATIEISEGSFILPSGLSVTREKIMQVLQDLKYIYIRATYWTKGVTTRLTGVSLDSAKETPSGLASAAVSVEQCQCPPNYAGLSCEECATGFFRAQTGPYGGFCIPCQCNGHAQDCDKVTGKCIDCDHNTEGDHCEKCGSGYHGNATVGLPYDCLICACPLPMVSNNFADSCDMSEDNEEISCDCKPGYTGYRCQACANGFYGNPEEIGDTCKPCNCSGNMNPDADESCDSVTGECKSCLNNAHGAACEICKPWFYGDAINLKNCQGCDCSECGAVRCNHTTGLCDCKANIVGEKCDRCELNHYGFSTCDGCLACECDKASNSKQCEPITGQCSCKPGVAGRRCDKCAPGHWNYSEEGCQKCKCKEIYSENVDCDAETGQCQCLPGVLGPTCDHCPELTVLDRVKGCLPCDTCVHTLVNATKQLSRTLDPYIQDFRSVNSTFYLTQRLNYIDNEVLSLKGNVTALEHMRLDMQPFETEMEKLKGTITTIKRGVQHEFEKAQGAIDDNLADQVNELKNIVADNVAYAKNVVREVAEIADSFESGKYGPKKEEFEEALAEAKEILEQLKNMKLEYSADEVRGNQLVRANKCLSDIETVKDRLDMEEENVQEFRKKLEDLESRLKNLDQHISSVKLQTDEINNLNQLNRNAKVDEKFKELKEKEELSNMMQKEAENYINSTTTLLSATGSLKQKVQNITSYIRENLKPNMTERYSKYEDLAELWDLVEKSREKADQMCRDVESDIIEAGNYNSSAVSAYKDIIQTIRDALMAANGSVVSAEKAEELTEGVGAKAAELSNTVNIQYNEGRKVVLDLDDLEKDLNKLRDKVTNLESTNHQSKQDINDIKSRLEKTDVDAPAPDVEIDDSTNEVAKKIVDKIDNIVNELPKKLSDSKELDKARKETKDKHDLALKQLEQAMNVTDNNELKNQVEELKERSDKINDRSDHVSNDLAKLRKQIQSLRELVNTNKVGVRFYRNSTLELRKPENMAMDEINNYISMYFKTEEPNGLLIFLGNEAGSSKRSRRHLPTDEFISLEVENGYAKLTVDLGTGAKSIVVNDKKVDDNTWYRASVDRTGKIISMSLQWEEVPSGEDKPKSMEKFKEALLEGNATILNLDRTKSKLYVGGFPSSFRAPMGVTYNSFDGLIEDITLGDQAVGLWNYVENVNARMFDYRRDSLENKTTTTGFRYNGDGYVEIASSDLRLRERSSIILKFKTFAEEGLMFLAAKENSYMSVELRKGQVLFQFDLGEGPVILATNKEKGYNTGTWHMLEAARDGKVGILKVDQIKAGQGDAPGSNNNLRVEHIYIGGYPNGHRIPTVTTRNFDGCIDDVQISGTQIDLNINNKAYGVTPGCPQKIAKVIWFDKGSRGYAGMPASLDDSKMELILRFKTDSENGTLVYLTNGIDPTTLKLVKGQVEFSSGGETVKTNSQGYADSQWHVIMATHSSNGLILFLDDYQSFTSEGIPRPIRLLSGTGKLFLGGVPSEVDANAALNPHFSGCLGQLTLNSQLFNLENMTDISRNVIIGKCLSLTDRRVMPPPLLELPSGLPTIPDEFETTQPPVIMTTTAVPRLTFDAPECKLPLYPEASSQKPKTVGYRFGTKVGSRLEYGLMKYGKHQFSITVDLTTRAEDGLLLYASDMKFFDFFAVYLKERKVYFKIKCGSEEKQLNSKEIPHDEWQTLTIIRNKSEVALKINNLQVDEANFRCGALNIEKPIYVGGINPDIFEKARISSLKDVDMVFDGCLKNFKMGSNLLGEPSAKYGVIPCSVNYETGVFFSPDGGYIKHFDKYSVGSKMTIEMEVKPRTRSGLLLSVHTARRDYIVLELVNGSVRIAVDNGAGEISSTFVPPDPFFFCDGNWHKIKAVKIKNVVTLAVDNKQAENGQGDRRQLTTDTKHPLFIGGKPRSASNPPRGIKSTSHFVGCIRSVKINDELQDISVHNAIGNVTVGVCPTT